MLMISMTAISINWSWDDLNLISYHNNIYLYGWPGFFVSRMFSEGPVYWIARAVFAGCRSQLEYVYTTNLIWPTYARDFFSLNFEAIKKPSLASNKTSAIIWRASNRCTKVAVLDMVGTWSWQGVCIVNYVQNTLKSAYLVWYRDVSIYIAQQYRSWLKGFYLLFSWGDSILVSSIGWSHSPH